MALTGCGFTTMIGTLTLLALGLFLGTLLQSHYPGSIDRRPRLAFKCPPHGEQWNHSWDTNEHRNQSMRCHSSDECVAGYCDHSLGHCVCLPGWHGRKCESLYLEACRTSSSSLVAPCTGFAGIMSCQCRRDCAAFLVVHGFAKRSQQLSAADLAPCWTSDGGEERFTSDIPHNTSSVHFWMSWESFSRSHGSIPAHFRRASRSASLDHGVVELPHTSEVQLWGPQPRWLTSLRMLPLH